MEKWWFSDSSQAAAVAVAVDAVAVAAESIFCLVSGLNLYRFDSNNSIPTTSLQSTAVDEPVTDGVGLSLSCRFGWAQIAHADPQGHSSTFDHVLAAPLGNDLSSSTLLSSQLNVLNSCLASGSNSDHEMKHGGRRKKRYETELLHLKSGLTGNEGRVEEKE